MLCPLQQRYFTYFATYFTALMLLKMQFKWSLEHPLQSIDGEIGNF